MENTLSSSSLLSPKENSSDEAENEEEAYEEDNQSREEGENFSDGVLDSEDEEFNLENIEDLTALLKHLFRKKKLLKMALEQEKEQ